MIIAGATGGGKSTLLRLIITVCHILYSDILEIWACDYKHGVEMSVFGEKPKLFTRTTSSIPYAPEFMGELYDEIERRNMIFRKHPGVNDIESYNETVPKKKRMKYILLIVDELAKLIGSKAIPALVALTGDGRSAGIRVILSVFRPQADIVPGILKNNIPTIVCFRANPVTAQVILGTEHAHAATMIDNEINGRCIYHYGMNDILTQVPWFSPKVTKKIMALYQNPFDPIVDQANAIIQEGEYEPHRI